MIRTTDGWHFFRPLVGLRCRRNLTVGWWLVSFTLLRACLHGCGGPQVGEVTRLAVVEQMARVYVNYNPWVPG